MPQNACQPKAKTIGKKLGTTGIRVLREWERLTGTHQKACTHKMQDMRLGVDQTNNGNLENLALNHLMDLPLKAGQMQVVIIPLDKSPVSNGSIHLLGVGVPLTQNRKTPIIKQENSIRGKKPTLSGIIKTHLEVRLFSLFLKKCKAKDEIFNFGKSPGPRGIIHPPLEEEVLSNSHQKKYKAKTFNPSKIPEGNGITQHHLR